MQPSAVFSPRYISNVTPYHKTVIQHQEHKSNVCVQQKKIADTKKNHSSHSAKNQSRQNKLSSEIYSYLKALNSNY